MVARQAVVPAFGQADLSNCEREQLQFAGSIQPHGALLAALTGTMRVTHASANLFSLIESAKLHDLDPVKYLAYVFKELPTCKVLADYEALLPYAVCDETLKISR